MRFILALLILAFCELSVAALASPKECVIAADDVENSQGAKIKTYLVNQGPNLPPGIGYSVEGTANLRQESLLESMFRICYMAEVRRIFRMKGTELVVVCSLNRAQGRVGMYSCEKVKPFPRKIKPIKEVVNKKA